MPVSRVLVLGFHELDLAGIDELADRLDDLAMGRLDLLGLGRGAVGDLLLERTPAMRLERLSRI